MRRGAIFAGLAVAALTALLVGAAGGAAAAEGGCEWRPHKVRVVKHVKRHGKRVKLVRHQVRWSCVAVPAAPVVTPPAPALPAPAPVADPTPPGEEPGNPHWFGAQAYEYKFEPTGATFEVAAGLDTIELINRGEDAHDLHLERLDTHATVLELKTTLSGKSIRGTANLEAGEYRLFCSLDDHAMRGMERTLIVP